MDHTDKFEQLVKAVADLSSVRAPVAVQSGSSSSAASALVDQVISPSSGSGVAETNSELRSISKRRRQLQKHCVEIPMDDAVRAEVNNYLQLKVDATVDDRRPAVVLEKCTAAGSLEAGCKNVAD